MESQESSDKRASQLRAGRHARPGRRRGRLFFTVAAAFSMLAAATVVTAYAVTAEPDTYSLFSNTDVSGVTVDPDTRPVEVGLKITSKSAGTLTAVRFLKAQGDTGSTHRVSVWSTRGERLASASSTGETRSGWQQVALASPLRVEAGQQYVVSYFTSKYRASQNWFAKRTAKNGPLSSVGGGVYAYGNSGGFPTDQWQSSNYWVDVVFKTQKASTPSQTPSVPPVVSSPPAGPTAPASPSVTPSTTAPNPPAGDLVDLPRVPWEGGPSYYAKFAKGEQAGWDDPDFFPIGVWYEGVYTQADVDKDKAAGLNTYVMLTEQSDMDLIKRNGMHAMTSESRKDSGAETTGWIINDEVDMWGGAGNSKWTGKYPGQGDPCTSGKYDCGFDVMNQLKSDLPANDGRMMYANFGKGVMFWQSDADASKFVNNYTSVVSNDIYWYTDPNVCYSASEGVTLGVAQNNCRRAANYGLTMDRMRKIDAIDNKRQPIYAFVELGKPFEDKSSPTITPEQVAGAVVNSLIHEARGVLYFNHNFGGSCITQHVLRDACGTQVRPTVTELDKHITSLAPVLNTQSYQYTFNPQLDTMLKAKDGSYYIFAMPGKTGGTGSQALTMPKGLNAAKAEVLYENRTVPITNGVLTDTFAKEFSYHIYKVTP